MLEFLKSVMLAIIATFNEVPEPSRQRKRRVALDRADDHVQIQLSGGAQLEELEAVAFEQPLEPFDRGNIEMVERVQGAIPLGRWGNPADIAGAVAFLCSADASWMTGEVVRVSGGLEGVSAAPPKRELPAEDAGDNGRR